MPESETSSAERRKRKGGKRGRRRREKGGGLRVISRLFKENGQGEREKIGGEVGEWKKGKKRAVFRNYETIRKEHYLL